MFWLACSVHECHLLIIPVVYIWCADLFLVLFRFSEFVFQELPLIAISGLWYADLFLVLFGFSEFVFQELPLIAIGGLWYDHTWNRWHSYKLLIKTYVVRYGVL